MIPVDEHPLNPVCADHDHGRRIDPRLLERFPIIIANLGSGPRHVLDRVRHIGLIHRWRTATPARACPGFGIGRDLFVRLGFIPIHVRNRCPLREILTRETDRGFRGREADTPIFRIGLKKGAKSLHVSVGFSFELRVFRLCYDSLLMLPFRFEERLFCLSVLVPQILNLVVRQRFRGREADVWIRLVKGADVPRRRLHLRRIEHDIAHGIANPSPRRFENDRPVVSRGLHECDVRFSTLFTVKEFPHRLRTAACDVSVVHSRVSECGHVFFIDTFPEIEGLRNREIDWDNSLTPFLGIALPLVRKLSGQCGFLCKERGVACDIPRPENVTVLPGRRNVELLEIPRRTMIDHPWPAEASLDHRLPKPRLELRSLGDGGREANVWGCLIKRADVPRRRLDLRRIEHNVGVLGIGLAVLLVVLIGAIVLFLSGYLPH